MRAVTTSGRARARQSASVAGQAGAAQVSPWRGLPVPALVRTRLAANLPWPVETVWTIAAGGAGAFAVGVAVAGSAATAIVFVVVAPVGGWFAANGLAVRFRRRAEAQLPEVVDAIVASLRAGASLRQATLEAAAAVPEPVARRLVPVVSAVERGVPLASAFDEWAARDQLTGVSLVAAALALAAQVGGGAANALEGVADTLRERLALQRELRALGSQARASAAVMVAAPLLFSAMAAGLDSGIAAFLFHSTPGALCLGAGVMLDLAGGWWMRRLTAGAP
jgi:tight adherence protein B